MEQANNLIEYTVTAQIACIALNRPPVNAINHALLDAIHAAMREADADPHVRAVTITGASAGMFCGGMDLKMVHDGDSQALRDFVTKFYLGTLDLQYALSKPSIAVINGPARGAGMTLALSCDVLIAADDIDLGYPEIDIGLIPAIHYVHLPQIIGRHKAFELLFGGKAISANEAATLGIINHAVPRAQLNQKAFDLAATFAAKSATIVALGRRSFLRANDLEYRRNIENQIETLCNVFSSADGREGIEAFVEKRSPVWQKPN